MDLKLVFRFSINKMMVIIFAIMLWFTTWRTFLALLSMFASISLMLIWLMKEFNSFLICRNWRITCHGCIFCNLKKSVKEWEKFISKKMMNIQKSTFWGEIFFSLLLKIVKKESLLIFQVVWEFIRIILKRKELALKTQ